MKLKTYLCDTMNQALQSIRAELGPDAVIISSLNEGDKVRVTAAYESSLLQEQAHATPERTYTELETKNMLCHILSYHQVPQKTGDQIITSVCAIEKPLFEKGLAGIYDHLFSFTPMAYNHNQSQPQFIMLAGPVGAGKTVTLAKLASEYLLNQKPVEIISADYLKAGAVEQIQIYANALNIPLTLAESAKDLERIITAAKPGVTYLIDTPGTNILNAYEIDVLTEFILAVKQPPYLVVPAGTDSYELRDISSAFKDLGCTRFIMTRFDSCKRLGGLLTILQDEKLALCALSQGPEIGSRLKQARSELVVDLMMKHLPTMLTTHERIQDMSYNTAPHQSPHSSQSLGTNREKDLNQPNLHQKELKPPTHPISSDVSSSQQPSQQPSQQSSHQSPKRSENQLPDWVKHIMEAK